jgi:hypothetical protein
MAEPKINLGTQSFTTADVDLGGFDLTTVGLINGYDIADLDNKLNLSGGTLSGDLNMGGNNFTTVGLINGYDIAALDDKFDKAGGTINGDVDLNTNDITNCSTINTHAVPSGSGGTFALLTDIPAPPPTPTLDSVLGAGNTATDKDFVLYELGGTNIILATDKTAFTVQIGSTLQNYDLELYGNINLHSLITGLTSITLSDGATIESKSITLMGGPVAVTKISPFLAAYFDTGMDPYPTMVYGATPFGPSSIASLIMAFDSTGLKQPLGVVVQEGTGGTGVTFSMGAAGFPSYFTIKSDMDIPIFNISNGNPTVGNGFNLDLAGASGTASISASAVTGVQTYSLPASGGTIALTTDIPDVTGLTGTTSASYTINNDDGDPIASLFGSTALASSSLFLFNTGAYSSNDHSRVLILPDQAALANYSAGGNIKGFAYRLIRQSPIANSRAQLLYDATGSGSPTILFEWEPDADFNVYGPTYAATFSMTSSALTNNRVYTYPDYDGEIAIAGQNCIGIYGGVLLGSLNLGSTTLYGHNATGGIAEIKGNNVDLDTSLIQVGQVISFFNYDPVGNIDQRVQIDSSYTKFTFGGIAPTDDRVLIRSTGVISLSADGTNFGNISPSALTATRTFTLPNATGVLCLDGGTPSSSFILNNDSAGTETGILFGGSAASDLLELISSNTDYNAGAGTFASIRVTGTQVRLGITTAGSLGSTVTLTSTALALANGGFARFQANTTGNIALQKGLGVGMTFDISGTTTARTATLPDADGTIAFVDMTGISDGDVIKYDATNKRFVKVTGLTNTYTFGGGASGDIASMTFDSGILTAVTTV